MTGPEARHIGLGWALEDFKAWLDKWSVDDVTDDVDDPGNLPVYEND